MNEQEFIEQFEDYIIRKPTIKNKVEKSDKNFILDFDQLIKDNIDMSNFILDYPEKALESTEYILTKIKKDEFPQHQNKIVMRLKNLHKMKSVHIPIRDIRSEHVGRLVCVKGTIKQTSEINPLVKTCVYECPGCSTEMIIRQNYYQLSTPTQCGCGRKKNFIEKRKELIDVQRIILEESVDYLEGSQQPKTRMIMLTEGLCKKELDKTTTVGNKVIIAGIIKEISKEKGKKGETTERILIVEANYIQPTEQTYEEINLTPEDLNTIKKLSKREDLVKIMIDSYSPDIFGNEDIKLGIILTAFGAINMKVEEEDKTITRKREMINILLIGDPGSGKSKLIEYAKLVIPRNRYVTASGSTGKGMTAIVTKEEITGAWVLEAGPVVLASGGSIIIDEFDKLNIEDYKYFHQFMESGEIKVNRANIDATLRAETSVIAAANPNKGRFDPMLTPAEQFTIPITILNRFDLIYLFQDQKNKERDGKIIMTMLDGYQKKKIPKPKISNKLLRKYIYYAKKNIHPELTEAAVKEIKESYIQIRNSQTPEKSLAVTPRQGDAIIRLSMASAKMRLSKKVLKKDVELAKEILIKSLKDIAINPETGEIEIDRIETGIGDSERKTSNLILKTFRELSPEKKMIREEELFMKVTETIGEEKYERIIEKMKRYGDIIEPKKGWIKEGG